MKLDIKRAWLESHLSEDEGSGFTAGRLSDETTLEVAYSRFIQDYINNLQWSTNATDREKTLVAGNIRGFAYYILKHMEAALKDNAVKEGK